MPRYARKSIKFKYVNPYAQLFFAVTDEKGNITHWSGELLPNPAQLPRNGGTRQQSTEAMQCGTPTKAAAASN